MTQQPDAFCDAVRHLAHMREGLREYLRQNPQDACRAIFSLLECNLYGLEKSLQRIGGAS
jgi:hypothetical protein